MKQTTEPPTARTRHKINAATAHEMPHGQVSHKNFSKHPKNPDKQSIKHSIKHPNKPRKRTELGGGVGKDK